MVLDADIGEEAFECVNVDDMEGASQESEGEEDMEYVLDLWNEWENTAI